MAVAGPHGIGVKADNGLIPPVADRVVGVVIERIHPQTLEATVGPLAVPPLPDRRRALRHRVGTSIEGVDGAAGRLAARPQVDGQSGSGALGLFSISTVRRAFKHAAERVGLRGVRPVAGPNRSARFGLGRSRRVWTGHPSDALTPVGSEVSSQRHQGVAKGYCRTKVIGNTFLQC